MEGRLREIVERRLGEEQYGYRKNRSTTDLLFALRMTVEKGWEYDRTIHIAFIDLRKAFDWCRGVNYGKC